LKFFETGEFVRLDKVEKSPKLLCVGDENKNVRSVDRKTYTGTRKKDDSR
jgi:hypothetical protein